MTVQKADHGVAEFNARYQPDASYELKGVDSDLSKLDVEKALSDLKKRSGAAAVPVFCW